MTKKTDKELWDALDDATLDAEIESAIAMTPEERRRELAAAGINLDEVHAKADAFFASSPAVPAPGPAVVAPRRLRPAVVVSIGLALAAGFAIAIKAAQPHAPVGSPPPDTPAFHAAALRQQARDECAAQRWKACLAGCCKKPGNGMSPGLLRRFAVRAV